MVRCGADGWGRSSAEALNTMPGNGKGAGLIPVSRLGMMRHTVD